MVCEDTTMARSWRCTKTALRQSLKISIVLIIAKTQNLHPTYAQWSTRFIEIEGCNRLRAIG